MVVLLCHHISIFLSTLSLRRATFNELVLPEGMDISIHALLTESDFDLYTGNMTLQLISIHALLTESDLFVCYMILRV